MMMRISSAFAGLLGLALLGIGAAWIVAPGSAAALLEMDLLDGAGLSSQIGDETGYFVTLGSCILLGLTRKEPVWFYPAIFLLAGATLGRLAAWMFHGAALTVGMMLFEVLLAALLAAIAVRLRQDRARPA